MACNPTITRRPILFLIGIALLTLVTDELFVGKLFAEKTKVSPSSQNLSPSQSEYKALIERFYDAVFNRPNLTEARNFIAPDYTDHNPINPKSVSGIDGLKHTAKLLRTGFPDLDIRVKDSIVGRDRIVARIRVRGTHQGEFMGVKPTGKQIDISAIEIYGIVGEKLSERWGNLDGIALFQQLGVIQTQETPDDHPVKEDEASFDEIQQSEVDESSNLTDLNDWEKLKADFMHEIGRVRIVALVSPN